MNALDELFPRKKKRAYRLSEKGLKSLRRSAKKRKPWNYSTGPKTRLGKFRSAQNALKHGLYAQDFKEEKKAYRAAVRKANRGK